MEVMDKGASEDGKVYVGKGMNFTPFEGRTSHRYSRKIKSATQWPSETPPPARRLVRTYSFRHMAVFIHFALQLH